MADDRDRPVHPTPDPVPPTFRIYLTADQPHLTEMNVWLTADGTLHVGIDNAAGAVKRISVGTPTTPPLIVWPPMETLSR